MRSLLLVLALTATVAAAPAEQELGAAETAYRDAEFERVLVACDRVIAAPDATPALKIEALRLKGSALVALDRTDEAKAVFRQIFAINSEFDLPVGTSPKIRNAFGDARNAFVTGVEEELATRLGNDLAAMRLGASGFVSMAVPSRPAEE